MNEFTLEMSRGSHRASVSTVKMSWHQKNLSGLLYGVVLTLICKTSEIRKWTERKQSRREPGKKISTEAYIKHLLSRNIINLEMDLGDHF